MDAIFEQLLLSPKLIIYFQQLSEVLESEKIKRDRFFEIITDQQKAEFINGEMIVQTPSKIEHNVACKLLLNLLHNFVSMKGLGFVGAEKLLISLTRNDYEPDICFFSIEKFKKFSTGQIRFPPPDFVVEILSASTEKIDRTVKFEDYAAHGVKEYWLVEPEKKLVEQYILEGSAFSLKIKANSGNLTSIVIKAFSIPISAIFDEKENLSVLRKLILSDNADLIKVNSTSRE